MTGPTHIITETRKEYVKRKRTDKYTGRFDYVELVWLKICEDLQESIDLEYFLKGYTHKEKDHLMRNVMLGLGNLGLTDKELEDIENGY
jgi:predicted GIY-YIG superfamily endonuclease